VSLLVHSPGFARQLVRPSWPYGPTTRNSVVSIVPLAETIAISCWISLPGEATVASVILATDRFTTFGFSLPLAEMSGFIRLIESELNGA
jgi:hypothetical protein